MLSLSKTPTLKIYSAFLLFILCFLFSCQQTNSTKDKISENRYYEEAWTHLEQHNDIEAYKNFMLAKNEFQRRKDSLGVGKSLMNAAIIQINAADYFGSEENNILALKYLEKLKNNIYLVSVYNSLALSRSNLDDHISALYWYNKALEVSTNEEESSLIKNNIAILYSKLEKYDEGIALLRKININYPKDPFHIKSKVVDNLAYLEYQKDSNYDAESEYYRALDIRKEEKDLFGQNASHAHLSDFYKNKNKAKALFHAREMLSIATQINNPSDKIEALEKLILLETPDNSKEYFSTYKKLDDSLQIARSKAKNQFALIRYDAEKHKADFLKAQRDNTLKQNQILKLYIALGTLLILVFTIFYFYKKKQKQNELNVKNTQLKYSKKVHDVVANGLYHTMIEVKNDEKLSKNQLLDKLENLYERSRDISNDSFEKSLQSDYANVLYKMLSSYSSPIERVFITGNNGTVWEKVSLQKREELYYVLRELMVNMKKHSQATIVSLVFRKEDELVNIKYTDNGIGLNNLTQKSGSGFQNMENRIASISGGIIFDKNSKNGLVVKIHIPA